MILPHLRSLLILTERHETVADGRSHEMGVHNADHGRIFHKDSDRPWC